MQEVKIGTYTGVGSIGSVICGFAPDHIEAFNSSEIVRWQTGMSSGAAFIQRGATGSLLRIESLGFAQLVKADEPTGNGFRFHESVGQVGTYYYKATRNS